MNEVIKNLIEQAKAEGAEIHVVQMGNEHKCRCTGEPEPKNDFFAEAKKEAAEVAQLNKILYEAHVCAGFTSEEALALTVATITCK